MITVNHNAPLLCHNTFGIAATARKLIEYDSVNELVSLCPLTEPVLHIGSGSNLLFVSPVVEATVLHSRIEGIDFAPQPDGSVLVTAGAAEKWDGLVEKTVDRGLGGLENLSLIPGETGSAAVQNIGAYGAEASDRIVSVETVDILTGQIRRFTAEECGYAYRMSVFKRPDHKRFIVTHVTLRLDSHPHIDVSYRGLAEALAGIDNPGVANVRHAVISTRLAKLPDPTDTGNAGSFFTNPIVDTTTAERLLKEYPDMPAYPVAGGRTKLSAGWLIDRAGWKGRTLGRAGVYERQALVLVNRGGATGADIAALADAIVADVHARFDITLTPEVNYI